MATRVDVNEYYRRYNAGEWNGVRVELLDGEVRRHIVPTPQRAAAMSRAHTALFRAFNGLAVVSTRLPVRLDEFWELEPDVSLKRGAIRDYDSHPTPADTLLILDVAGVASAKDSRLKASIYARAGIVEYWILDVENRHLEIHRGPQRDSAMPFGWGYSVRLIVPESGRAAMQWKPNVEFAVADLLGRRSE